MPEKNIIYKITNKINGKCYIGKTCHFTNRMSDHKNSITDSIVGRAIKKYGRSNFSYDIIHTTEKYEELDKWENFYIKKFNSLIPNGYNIVLPEKDSIILHKLTLKKYLLNTTNKWGYHGIFFKKGFFWCQMVYLGKLYLRSSKTIEEAAELYDMLLIHFYGHDCIVNFPDKLNYYLNHEIYKNILFYFRNGKKVKSSSQFFGVCWTPSNKKWKSYYHDDKHKQFSIGYFTSEKVAAFMRDIYMIILGLDKILNFPEILNKLNKEKIVYYYNNNELGKSPIGKGIYFNKTQKKWHTYFQMGSKKIYLGNFTNKEEARHTIAKFGEENNLYTFIPISSTDFSIYQK